MSGSRAEIQFQLYATKPAVEPCGSPGATSGRLPRVTQVLALAIQFQDMIERGDARDYADLARLGCLSRERMSQIMELIWLAPDIQQEILGFPSTRTSRFPVAGGRRMFLSCPEEGSVNVEPSRLRQWRIDTGRLAELVALAVGLPGTVRPIDLGRLFHLGRRRLAGRFRDLFLVAGDTVI
jgi:hypothetical protein